MHYYTHCFLWSYKYTWKKVISYHEHYTVFCCILTLSEIKSFAEENRVLEQGYFNIAFYIQIIKVYGSIFVIFVFKVDNFFFHCIRMCTSLFCCSKMLLNAIYIHEKLKTIHAHTVDFSSFFALSQERFCCNPDGDVYKMFNPFPLADPFAADDSWKHCGKGKNYELY